MTSRSLGVICTLLVLLGGMAYGQPNRGTIEGVVKDEKGAPLVGVTVEVTSTAYREAHVTGRKGRFHFEVPLGVYTLRVRRMGLAPLERADVRATPNRPVTLDLVLDPIPACSQSPADLCACIQEIRGMMQSLEQTVDSFSDPETLIPSIWPEEYWLYGPESIHVSATISYNSPGWWFRIYRPSLSIDDSAQQMSIGAKAGVEKTRGALQFGWRVAGHQIDLPLPQTLSQYLLLREQATQDLGLAAGYLDQICSVACLHPCVSETPTRPELPRSGEP